MSVKISSYLAGVIAQDISSFIRRVKIYFSDNTDYLTDNVLTEVTQNSVNNSYIINIMFSVNLDVSKTITKIEYYYFEGTNQYLVIWKDAMNTILPAGINSLSHQLTLNYQV